VVPVVLITEAVVTDVRVEERVMFELGLTDELEVVTLKVVEL